MTLLGSEKMALPQPIEQLSGLRAIPNLNIFRPADRIETISVGNMH